METKFFLVIKCHLRVFLLQLFGGHFAPIACSYTHVLFPSSSKISVNASLSLLLYHLELNNIISTVV